MLEEFENPPRQFRPSPFWSWNDALNNEELVRQIRDFKDRGFGGYFMHSRVGLRTKYLGPEWMDRIAACIGEGRKLDMESWLYDEDKWPSGAAGGLVTRGHDELRSRGLSLVRSPLQKGTYLAVFDIDVQSSWYRMVDADSDVKHERIAFEVVLAPKTNWFNGQSYVDLLNPKAVRAFLRTTYDPYASRFGDVFGEFMPGIFTDEPHIRSGDIPWTDAFPSYFQEMNGYDVVSRLPELFFDLPNSPKTRHDFWRAITKLFVETFSKRLYEWCESHGTGLTGHYLREDTLLSQMLHAGAAMPHYEFQQYPGIDHLGRNINNPLTLKQVSSAASQFGRQRVLCEIFGVSGHSMTFEDQKWIADFHFALGINLMCQHLVLYSMKGNGKRDYPPTFSYHQPYWSRYRYMNDYLARCSYAISFGQPVDDILLLHPITTAWTVWRKGSDDIVNDYNRRFVDILTWLLGSHRDFNLGDEMIMERHARASSGTLSVGEMEYKGVIVPPSTNWGRGVLDLLTEFRGPILFVGETPTMVDGQESSEWASLLRRSNVFWVSEDKKEIALLLEKLIPREVSITSEDGREITDIYCNHRVADKDDLYFIANTSRTESHSAIVKCAARGPVMQWNPADGSAYKLDADISGGMTVVNLDLPPAGSAILTIGKAGGQDNDQELPGPDRAGTRCNGSSPAAVAGVGHPSQPGVEREHRSLAGPWSFRRTHPNSITLDYCRLSINGSPYGEVQAVWKTRNQVRKHFGLHQYDGIQPWVMDEKQIELAEANEVKLLFEFEVREVPQCISLVLEEGFKFDLNVNGKNVNTATDEWHWDRQFSRIDISGTVVNGTNRMTLQCRYQWDTEIEDIYLVGDFGVESDDNRHFCLGAEPAKLRPGDWGQQGYPFYSGNMIYQSHVDIAKRDGETYFLDVAGVKGSLCCVAVNGKQAGVAAWQPWRIDITPWIKNGSNSIDVEVVSTLRNTMGPLHHTQGDRLPWVGPEQFVDEKNWTDDYQFVSYGILENLVLAVYPKAE